MSPVCLVCPATLEGLLPKLPSNLVAGLLCKISSFPFLVGLLGESLGNMFDFVAYLIVVNVIFCNLFNDGLSVIENGFVLRINAIKIWRDSILHILGDVSD